MPPQSDAKAPLRESVDGERETEILEAIRQEAEDISAECSAGQPRSSRSADATAGSSGPSALLEVEYELLDVDPMSIDEYMNRVLIRSQQVASGHKGGRAVPQPSLPEFPPATAPAADERPTEAFFPAVDSNCSVSIEAPATGKAGPSAHRPRVKPRSARNLAETRANRNNLREIVIESTRNTLVRHIRRRHHLVIFRKLLLIFMALGLATFLYAAHFVYGVPLRHLAWGATAIGLVALLGMVQLWSRAARQQARLLVRVSYASRNPKAGVGKAGGRPASPVDRHSSA